MTAYTEDQKRRFSTSKCVTLFDFERISLFQEVLGRIRSIFFDIRCMFLAVNTLETSATASPEVTGL